MEILGEILFGILIIMIFAYVANDVERRGP